MPHLSKLLRDVGVNSNLAIMVALPLPGHAPNEAKITSLADAGVSDANKDGAVVVGV